MISYLFSRLQYFIFFDLNPNIYELIYWIRLSKYLFYYCLLILIFSFIDKNDMLNESFVN